MGARKQKSPGSVLEQGLLGGFSVPLWTVENMSLAERVGLSAIQQKCIEFIRLKAYEGVYEVKTWGESGVSMQRKPY